MAGEQATKPTTVTAMEAPTQATENTVRGGPASAGGAVAGTRDPAVMSPHVPPAADTRHTSLIPSTVAPGAA